MISDVINDSGQSVLQGPPESLWAETPFLPTHALLPKDIIAAARDIAVRELGWPRLPEGTYMFDTTGTIRRYQTAAETARQRNGGADLIGKSTVLELEAVLDCGIARHFGMTLATNYAVGINPEDQAEVTSDHVVDMGRARAEVFGELLARLLKRLHQGTEGI